ncbi:MAG: hypothetical protein LBU91_00125 [Bacteroidales bacterium]|nr:hypothetical protein [Bacteroidales bacterium]
MNIIIISPLLMALVILLPLIRFYQRSSWTKRQKLINILFFSFLFFLFYVPLHEFSHLICGKLMNVGIVDYQLYSKFSSGKFQNAYVNFSSLTTNQRAITLIAPYGKDIVFAIVSFLILKRKRIKSAFLVGLFFSIGLLFSTFDIMDNLLGYVNKFGDWNSLSKIIGYFWTWFIGISILSISTFLTCRIFIIYKGFPEKNN